MTRVLFITAFLLGAIVVAWMGLDFVGTDALALTVTLVIGVVYIIGFIEQLQFRKTTETLARALDAANSKIENLDQWLDKLHPSLQNSTRLRIEGERVGLPAPVLTPYLVGLLVMLGLMGTFVGMVVTLKGAVIALEGTTELQAVRAGLAAPIGGLGLAFGTSVAGVAASAMLGLISTLSRRDRMMETSRLDTKIATVFRDFSLVHNRQETFKALQYQAQALPDVAEKLQSMADKLEKMGDTIGNKLIENQDKFHASVTGIYSDLASSVNRSMQETLSESGRSAGESLKPIMKAAMEEMTQESRESHQRMNEIAKDQLQAFTVSFEQTTNQVTEAWESGIKNHENLNTGLTENMNESFGRFSRQFIDATETLLSNFTEGTSNWLDAQKAGDEERLNLWNGALSASQTQSAHKLDEASASFSLELSQIAAQQKDSMKNLSQEFKSVTTHLSGHLESIAEQSLHQQQQLSESLELASTSVVENTESASKKLITEMSGLLETSEKLVEARMNAEEKWSDEQGARIESLTATLKEELVALRDEEAQRGVAATERLSELEASVSDHLGSLGKSLEEPMMRLIETASETPKAAAEVIEKLRNEISNNLERDNGLLEERRSLIEELNTLLASIAETTSGQRGAIEELVSSSTSMMKDVSAHFSENINSEVTKINDIADQFAGSASEMSALGETFGFAVQLFTESNQTMIENLEKIETSLDTSNTRSDEQLAYYVTQAREIIDHSMMSQKEILEEMKQLGRQPDLFTETVV